MSLLPKDPIGPQTDLVNICLVPEYKVGINYTVDAFGSLCHILLVHFFLIKIFLKFLFLSFLFLGK